ncbi:hypothetical protein [Variovorax sp. OV329]|uniref:hypothetical protein n=1 Tax=Variovorax sp. OV329 TaxID=1882825 RepID=UPI000B18B1F3|nr:hypothetical protein [Variovorax sp. OV329]
MTTLSSPSFATRSPQYGLRHKHVSPSRPRAATQLSGSLESGNGMAPDSVFKRFPAIGDTPVRDKQAF